MAQKLNEKLVIANRKRAAPCISIADLTLNVDYQILSIEQRETSLGSALKCVIQNGSAGKFLSVYLGPEFNFCFAAEDIIAVNEGRIKLKINFIGIEGKKLKYSITEDN